MSAASSLAVMADCCPVEYEGDIDALAELIRSGAIDPARICAVTGHTEGSAGSGNTSRIAMDSGIRQLLTEHGVAPVQIAAIPMVFSAGDAGILSPNFVVYSRRTLVEGEPTQGALSLGISVSRALLPEEIGRRPMIGAAQEATHCAVASAGLVPAEARFVIAKSCRVTAESAEEARSRGFEALEPTLGSTMLASSGATALGIGIALGDIPAGDYSPESSAGLDPWTSRASVSSGTESNRIQLVAFGNSTSAGGPLRIGHAVLEDALDVRALYRALRDTGLNVPDFAEPRTFADRVKAIYIKVGADPTLRLRGRRQIVGQEMSYLLQLKNSVGSMFAAALQDSMIYISAGAVHQGPPGGGSVAVVVDVSALP